MPVAKMAEILMECIIDFHLSVLVPIQLKYMRCNMTSISILNCISFVTCDLLFVLHVFNVVCFELN